MGIVDSADELRQQTLNSRLFTTKPSQQSRINIYRLTWFAPPLSGDTADHTIKDAKNLQLLAETHGRLQYVVETRFVVRLAASRLEF